MATNEQIDKQLVDEAIQAYVDWQEERAHVRDAYARWGAADSHNAGLAFSAYHAALEREEHASLVYAEQMAQIEAGTREPGPVARARRLLPW
jgi:uncharacterized protein with PIN domain